MVMLADVEAFTVIFGAPQNTSMQWSAQNLMRQKTKAVRTFACAEGAKNTSSVHLFWASNLIENGCPEVSNSACAKRDDFVAVLGSDEGLVSMREAELRRPAYDVEILHEQYDSCSTVNIASVHSLMGQITY